MHLRPIPEELLAFFPLDGTDSRFGQLYKNINDKAYEAAGIEGFLPHNPFNGIREHATTLPPGTSDFPFPNFSSLAELNAEMILKWNSTGPNGKMPFWTEEDIVIAMRPDDDDEFSTAPTPQVIPLMPAARERPEARKLPTIIELHALLIRSKDRLFVIAQLCQGCNER